MWTRDGTDEGEERFANLQELRGVAAQYMPGMAGMPEEQTPLALFLEEVSLVSDVDDFDAESGAVTLLTLHTAKGLEFPGRVYCRHGGRHLAAQPQHRER